MGKAFIGCNESASQSVSIYILEKQIHEIQIIMSHAILTQGPCVINKAIFGIMQKGRISFMFFAFFC